MVRCCWATLHRLGHPGKQGSREIWYSVPIPVGEGIGKRRRRRHAWEIGHQPRQTTGTSLTISRFAHPMFDITAKKWITENLQCRADHRERQVLMASGHVEEWEKWVQVCTKHHRTVTSLAINQQSPEVNEINGRMRKKPEMTSMTSKTGNEPFFWENTQIIYYSALISPTYLETQPFFSPTYFTLRVGLRPGS